MATERGLEGTPKLRVSSQIRGFGRQDEPLEEWLLVYHSKPELLRLAGP
jgi:hypothetical protein